MASRVPRDSIKLVSRIRAVPSAKGPRPNWHSCTTYTLPHPQDTGSDLFRELLLLILFCVHAECANSRRLSDRHAEGSDPHSVAVASRAKRDASGSCFPPSHPAAQISFFASAMPCLWCGAHLLHMRLDCVLGFNPSTTLTERRAQSATQIQSSVSHSNSTAICVSEADSDKV